jgi:glycosyltransferase involved in cell wall biosynthesis
MNSNPIAPKISIITPSFNRAWAISACIRSLQNQNEQNYEHIIIDGGSTDNTLEILDHFCSSDARIRYISEPDAGMYDAINKGFRMASGDIVAYLNTDDIYLPGALSSVIETFSQYPDISMLYGNWMSWHPETSFLEIMPVLKYVATDMAYFACLPQPSVFMRRCVFDTCGFLDTSYKLLADNEFFSRVAFSEFKFIRIDSYLSVQTVHSGNLLAGNIAATNQALQEGGRYRRQLQEKLKARLPLYILIPVQIRTLLTKSSLCMLWRMNLVWSLLFAAKNNTSNANLAPWRQIGGAWSLPMLVRYLLALSNRHRYPFYKVPKEKLARFLGFVPPDPASKI